MVSILNTIVCYKNSDEIVTYIMKVAELYLCENVAVSVIINDDETNEQKLRNRLSAINIRTVVSRPGKNLGYLNGMLEAVKIYKEQYQDDIKWIIMSNTDISYPDNKFIEKFLTANYEDSIWCVGPSVYVPSKGSYDNPILKERRSLFAVNKTIIVFSIPFIKILYQVLSNLKAKICKTNEPKSDYVYEVHGCYFIISEELYTKILDKPFLPFMYSEEAYISEMIYQNKKQSYYDASLKIEHNEHSVTSGLKYKKIAKYIAESMKYIKKEFYK